MDVVEDCLGKVVNIIAEFSLNQCSDVLRTTDSESFEVSVDQRVQKSGRVAEAIVVLAAAGKRDREASAGPAHALRARAFLELQWQLLVFFHKQISARSHRPWRQVFFLFVEALVRFRRRSFLATEPASWRGGSVLDGF